MRLFIQDYITLVHSCLTITTPFALISSYSTTFELKHAFTLSKATRLFVDAKLLPNLLPVANEVGIPTDKIYLLLGNAPGFKTVHDFVSDTNERRIPFIGIRPAKNDTLAYLVFSSGTSGLPKGEFESFLTEIVGKHFNSCYDFSWQSKLLSRTINGRR